MERLHHEERLRRLEAVIEHGGNKSAAALYLGMSPDTMRAGFTGMLLPELIAERDRILAEFSAHEDPPANLDIVERLLKTGVTLDQLCVRSNATPGQVLDELDQLTARGLNVIRTGDLFRIEKGMPVGNVGEFISFQTDDRNRIKFGLSSDKHTGSKYHRLDVMESLYAWFADEGVTAVLDSGNYIEGESRFNKYDINVHGLEAQAQNLVATLPQIPGLTTYAVSGDDHEGWYAQREGLDIGRYVESAFRSNGREDWVNLGYMEAYVEIVNGETGVVSKVLVMHPGGGSAYATSYRPQKIVEGFEGGEKPAALLIGHYHKLSVNLIRNVWAVQCGCAQDQTPFMRKKGIDAHIGGVVAEFEQDPETGALVSCKTEIRRFFNQGYYNHRWTPHQEPVLPRRTANRAD